MLRHLYSNQTETRLWTDVKSELSLIQCDTNFNVIENSRVFQLKFNSVCAFSFILYAQMSMDEILYEQFGIFVLASVTIFHNPISDNISLSRSYMWLYDDDTMRRRYFIVTDSNAFEEFSREMCPNQTCFNVQRLSTYHSQQ